MMTTGGNKLRVMYLYEKLKKVGLGHAWEAGGTYAALGYYSSYNAKGV
jgi:hypothetical protein